MAKIIRGNAFEPKKKKLGLKFNPGLALISLRTTGPCALASYDRVEERSHSQQEVHFHRET